MRLYSTPESVEADEPTVLAIAETLIAMSIAVWIAVRWDTYVHIAVGACVAPLLLLRTERSVERGLQMFERWAAWSWCAHRPVTETLVQMILPAISLAVRFIATAQAVLTQPARVLHSLPRNWLRTVLSTDLRSFPEIIPGYEAHGSIRQLKISDDVIDLRRASTPTRLAMLLPYLIAACLFYVPSIAYRWSLKSTSLIYLPLLWLVSTTFRKIRDLATALKRVRHTDLARIVTIYSTIVLAAFITKLTLAVTWTDFAPWLQSFPLGRFLSIYIAPEAIPIWQLAAATNAVLAIGLFLFASHALFQLEHDEPWPEKAVIGVLRWTFGVRGVLTLYTIACTLYLTVQAASEWNLPPLGEKLFPWW